MYTTSADTAESVLEHSFNHQQLDSPIAKIGADEGDVQLEETKKSTEATWQIRDKGAHGVTMRAFVSDNERPNLGFLINLIRYVHDIVGI